MTGQRRRARGWIVGGGLLLLFAAVWLVIAWLRKPEPVPPDKIARVERGQIARSVVAVGRIHPLTKVEVKSKANGIIQALTVDVGDHVDENQVLAELDKENLEAQVREARATKDAEAANLEVALAAEAKARIEAANPELEFARRDFERLKALFAEKVASQQALDEAQKAHAMSANRQQLLEAAARSASALSSRLGPGLRRRRPRWTAPRKTCAMPPSAPPSGASCSPVIVRWATPSLRF